ncbi:RluA family pseudouridine synthase [Niveispirillum irakense]|uniref:RluA family pseudouridine synthase n=1 Tax=Niveispirillum irakense TaxID=34011 RepID=UPI001FE069FE|nr:RluA family pseudouridine synthase [Niveispirillum irakense]
MSARSALPALETTGLPAGLDFDDMDDDLIGGDLDVATDAGGPAHHQVMVAAAQEGERLDRALADALAAAGLSRSRLAALIAQGHVATGGQTIEDGSRRVKQGQCYDVTVPASAPATPQPQAIPLSIIYEDADLLVIDKAAGMVVHPAAGNADGTLVNALLHHCGADLSGIGGVRRPGIVHRLDKDTSGLIVVAKNDKAHQGLSAQFADRSLSRTYQAVVWGVPAPRSGEITGNIGRHPSDRKRMAVLERGGKPAITRYTLLRALGPAASLVECKLLTGRTHQIRVHMTHIGHPLVGDQVYGRIRQGRTRGVSEAGKQALAGFPRQALHAAAIEFIHPATGVKMGFTTVLPDDFKGLIQALETL